MLKIKVYIFYYGATTSRRIYQAIIVSMGQAALEKKTYV